jgi:hypothetical protein
MKLLRVGAKGPKSPPSSTRMGPIATSRASCPTSPANLLQVSGFTINLFDRKRVSVAYLGTLEPREKHKPEVLFLADYAHGADGEDKATILVMSDGARNGRPQLYELPIPRA